jgi:hypothetical protein
VDAPGAETGSLEARLVAADPRQAHRTAFAPIRAAPVGPWVRFGPETRLLEASGPWHLEVRERRGHGFGLAPVQRVVGIQPGLVAVRLETLGAVRGRVIDDRGRRVDQARVRLVPRDGTGEVREAVTTADGAFRVSWIVPGAYRVEVRSPLHATAHSDVVVLEGLTAALDLTPVALETMPVAGLLEGFGVATDGDDEVLLTLRSLSTPERTFLTRVPPATTADTPFEISDVPPGRYELTVHTEHFGRWDPSRLTVIAPADDLRIRRRRATETDVEFRVTSDQGEPVPAFSAFVRLDEKDDPATTKVCPGRNGRLLLRRLPLDASVAWVIRAPGAVPIRGRASAANLRGAPTEFQLEPGWGNRVRVLDEHGRPVPGVTITLDGVPAGVTDDHGVLDVLAERPPKRIGLGDPKLRVRAGDVFDDGTFRDLIWGIEVIAGEPGHATPPVKGDGR